MKFVVGIGNPGKSYEKTRHNIGFRVLESLSRKFDAKAAFRKKSALQAKAYESGETMLVLPETFVNLSGETVKALGRKLGAKPADILVVCDDVNLVFPKMRFRASGSAGGPHGLESVIAALGSEDFARLRIGVANEGMPKQDVAPFVLDKFAREEEKALEKVLEKASKVCESWIREGSDGATACLSRLQSIKEEKKAE